MSDVAAIIAGLTKAQRRFLKYARPHARGYRLDVLSLEMRALDLIASDGLSITPLGLQVRAHLTKEQPDD